eukprot:CAMPEP_0204017450 /NCGR_PEP_ID=MMETSP0360-20130528/27417_1 /ASSEMBLY_ACC=CAM_ASM_000342 /TAXON_ID=268821 /ORGANISM="Scrippsiella Hangoei, Strain SHTV-5" /LENGTH=46 /DNA_ID= /DNA_START= /DNA_END= /DNA_ORIENTATION=
MATPFGARASSDTLPAPAGSMQRTRLSTSPGKSIRRQKFLKDKALT